MRKLIVILIAMVIFTNTHAQISDTDAKLQYQQITDAFENTAYYKAAQTAEELKIKMGRWTPKVLYIYLQSVYKNYTETRQVLTGKFPLEYNYFTGFKNKADSFFLLVDKANYPPEKYNDMVTAQQYFQQMVEKYQYQQTRTPEKALAFLNQCAEKFASQDAGGQPVNLNNGRVMFTHSRDANDPCVGKYINFRTDSGYLFVRVINKRVFKLDKKLSSVIINHDVIDLCHTPSTDAATTGNFAQSYCYLHHNIYYQKDIINFPKEDTLSPRRTGIDKFEFTAVYTGSRHNEHNVHNETALRMAIGYPILDLFDNTNNEFVEGDYAKRITEAYNYLLNYYPKEKSAQPVKKVEDRTNGF